MIDQLRKDLCSGSDSEIIWFCILLLLLGALIQALVTGIFHNDKGYRQGQIDAANGHWEYELTRNEDGEEVWVKKKPGDQEVLDS